MAAVAEENDCCHKSMQLSDVLPRNGCQSQEVRKKADHEILTLQRGKDAIFMLKRLYTALRVGHGLPHSLRDFSDSCLRMGPKLDVRSSCTLHVWKIS